MNTLTIEIMVPKPERFEIPIPFFARSGDNSEYIGLLDENTFVSLFKLTDYTVIENKSASSAKERLVHGFKSWQHCSEEDFFNKYNAVLESISLTPKLVV